MQIRAWDIRNIGELASVYNTQVAHQVPHCFPISGSAFKQGARFQMTGEDHTTDLYGEKLMVVEEASDILGFAHMALGEVAREDERQEGGFIHFLTYERGQRAAGQGLLTACEQYLLSDDITRDNRIWGFDGYYYPFYHFGFPLVSDHMAHIYGLFGVNGYRIAGEGEIFMAQRDYATTEPEHPTDMPRVKVELVPGDGYRPGVAVRAVDEGRAVGGCVGIAGGHLSPSEGDPDRSSEDWIFIDLLWVTEEGQGRGWGRYLLAQTLWEARHLGYRHTAISTSKTNYRAQLFYANYGYQVTDTVYGFVKTTHRSEKGRPRVR